MQELLVHSVRRLTAGPAKRCGRRSRHIWQNTLLFLCARPIVRTMPTTSFAIMASHTTYTSTQQQYIHVCAHYGTDGTTCSTFDIPYSSSVQYARNIMGLFFYKAHARGAQVLCYPYVPGTMAFGVSEWMLLVPQAVARWTVRGQ